MSTTNASTKVIRHAAATRLVEALAATPGVQSATLIDTFAVQVKVADTITDIVYFGDAVIASSQTFVRCDEFAGSVDKLVAAAAELIGM